MKVVINRCFGGFSLSDKAIDSLKELATEKGDKELLKLIERDERSEEDKKLFAGGKYQGLHEIDRTHPLLIKVVEELGEEANTHVSNLQIVEIPNDVEWEISKYDGVESVEEKHRSWC